MRANTPSTKLIAPPPQPQEQDLNHHPCRICNEPCPTRKLRNIHELTCNGTPEANLSCKFCHKTFDSTTSRIFHQGGCGHKQTAASPSKVKWTCPRCNWKLIKHMGQGPSKIEDARTRHTQQCRGSDLLNRTCTKCNKVWDNMTARLAHQSQCKTDEEQRTCRCCNQLWETKHQSRESSETPRYFLNNVMSLIFPTHFSPSFPLAVLPDSTPSYPAHTHTPTHTHVLMHTIWGRCSLAPNVLWRPRSRPLTAAQRMSTPSHTCHTCARVHTLTHTIYNQGGGVLWHLTSFGAPKTALWR